MPDITHRCPRCELILATMGELEDHLTRDHHVDLRRPNTRLAGAPTPQPTPQTEGTLTVPVDPTRPPTPAVDVAVDIARRAGMALEFVAVSPPGLPSGSATAYVSHRARDAAAAGAPVTSSQTLPTDRPADAIVGHVAATGSDLLCMATHGRGRIGGLALGSVSQAVLQRSTVPVLLVGPGVDARAMTYETLLVGLDGSDLAERALAVADTMADRLAAALFLVEVIASPETVPSDVAETSYLQRLAPKLQAGTVDYDTVQRKDPADAILDLATDHRASIIVLGTHGRSRLQRVTAGSVALDVVRRASCPVLLVPPTAVVADPAPD